MKKKKQDRMKMIIEFYGTRNELVEFLQHVQSEITKGFWKGEGWDLTWCGEE